MFASKAIHAYWFSFVFQSGLFSYFNDQGISEEMELQNDLFVRNDVAEEAGL